MKKLIGNRSGSCCPFQIRWVFPLDPLGYRAIVVQSFETVTKVIHILGAPPYMPAYSASRVAAFRSYPCAGACGPHLTEQWDRRSRGTAPIEPLGAWPHTVDPPLYSSDTAGHQTPGQGGFSGYQIRALASRFTGMGSSLLQGPHHSDQPLPTRTLNLWPTSSVTGFGGCQ